METTLTIDLFEPGMGPLHRAGLGGLAATIRCLNLTDGFGFDRRRVTLSWARQEGAADFFQRLYESAFDLKDGLIHLPGSYDTSEPSPEVKAELQHGMSQTILQFGPNRKADGPQRERTYEVDGQPLVVRHQNLIGYTHRSAWRDLVTARGTLKPRVAISGTIAPGFVQRHVAFPSTTIEQPPGPAIALHFALVGTFALAIDRRTGTLIIPDVEDLERFAILRGWLTPRSARDCRIAGAADAALQAFVRLRQETAAEALGLRRCLAVLFATQNWNEKQKGRAAVLDVEPDRGALARFDVAMKQLSPRLVRPTKPAKGEEKPVPFWADSVVRPLVAENLARGRPWFQDFRRLVVAPDGSTDEQKVRQLDFEKEGLHAMIEEPWDDRGEERLVSAVHDAMGWRFFAIREETKYDPQTKANQDAYRNRLERQVQEWRLALSGARTADDVRKALGDLWSRSVLSPHLRFNQVLKGDWATILPLICDDSRWKLNRDLALLALASYGGPRKAGSEQSTGIPQPVDDDE